MQLWTPERPEGRLITKAATSIVWPKYRSVHNDAENRARMEALGDVAADVLHMCATFVAFTMAIRGAVKANPWMGSGTATRERAAEYRANWYAALIEYVQRELGKLP